MRRLILVPVFLPKELAGGCTPGSRPSPKRASQGRSNGGGSQPPANSLGAVHWGPSSSLDSQPNDAFFLLCTVQLPFPITSPFTTVAVALLQSLESQNPSKLPWTLAQTHCLDRAMMCPPGTKVQPFPYNADLAGPSLRPVEDLQGSLAGIRAWERVGNVPPLSPKGSALS